MTVLVAPADANTTADLTRWLTQVTSEYCSFLAGAAKLLDSVDHCGANAPPGEAAHWEALRRQFLTLLIQHGVRPTAQVGQPVDLSQHEVVEAVPAAAAPDTIVAVVQAGLDLHILGQRLRVRQARVVVAAPAAEANCDSEPPESRAE